MRNVFLILSIALAFFLEWLGARINFWGMAPPLVAALVFFWFWRMDLPTRAFTAVAAGFFIDSMSVFPFGAYIITFFLIGLLMELFRFLFANVRSLATQVTGMGIMLAVFFIVIPATAFILGKLRETEFVFPVSYSPWLGLGALAWVLIILALYAVLIKFFNLAKN